MPSNPAPPVPAGPTGGYVLPIVHTRLPERAVELGFWGALATAAALGAVDLPLAALVAAGVVVARHAARH